MMQDVLERADKKSLFSSAQVAGSPGQASRKMSASAYLAQMVNIEYTKEDTAT